MKFVFALILFLPTTVLVESYIYLLYLPIFLYYKRQVVIDFFLELKEKPFKGKFILSFWLLSLTSLFILINLFLGEFSFSAFLKSPILYIPLTIMAAYLVADKQVFKYLIFLVIIEILIGISQYALGVNTYFGWVERGYEFMDYKALYHTRVFGLSDNSSYLAMKTLFAMLALTFINFELKPKYIVAIFATLYIGLILTFGRTTLVVYLVTNLVLAIIYLVKTIRRVPLSLTESYIYKLHVLSLGVFLLFNEFFIYQFTRLDMTAYRLDLDSESGRLLSAVGLDGVEMAGRKELWTKALDFISENLIFGNHSTRFLVNGMHVHNSFLELLSTHGLIIFGGYVAFIIFHLNKLNFWIVGFICFYSMGQFGIFWNISFLDILLFSLLLFSKRLFHDENKISI